MTVEELFSVQRDDNKLRSLYMELVRHEDFNPYKGNIVSDMPKGSGGKSFLDKYIEKKEYLKSQIDFYERKIQEDRKMIDAYIERAPYPECDIIRYRVINNMSWEEIGEFTGYSRFQVSRKFWNYVKDAHNARNAHGKV